jgi:hypothetical protein
MTNAQRATVEAIREVMKASGEDHWFTHNGSPLDRSSGDETYEVRWHGKHAGFVRVMPTGEARWLS